METIIRTPAVALQTRQLNRPSDQDRKVLPAVATREAVAPVAPPAAEAVVPPFADSGKIFTDEIAAPVASHVDIRLGIERGLANVRAQLEQDMRNARALAERDGHASGLEKGEAAAKQAVAEQVERLASICAALHQARASVMESTEDLVVEIAYTAVCRIIGQTAVAPAAVASMVNQLLCAFRERDQLVVRLNPQDLDLVQKAPGIAALDQQAVLRPDPSIKVGGCVVESDAGHLDARLETQLARLCETLLSARRNREHGGEAV
jgi:flagellar assembly protein FliH